MGVMMEESVTKPFFKPGAPNFSLFVCYLLGSPRARAQYIQIVPRNGDDDNDDNDDGAPS